MSDNLMFREVVGFSEAPPPQLATGAHLRDAVFMNYVIPFGFPTMVINPGEVG